MRQLIGCGYEPAVPQAKPWQPPQTRLGYRHRPLPTVCAGYSTRLPEVTEIARAHTHWSKGSLDAFCGEPSEFLLLGIEILEGEMAQVQTYALADKKDGGGRE